MSKIQNKIKNNVKKQVKRQAVTGVKRVGKRVVLGWLAGIIAAGGISFGSLVASGNDTTSNVWNKVEETVLTVTNITSSTGTSKVKSGDYVWNFDKYPDYYVVTGKSNINKGVFPAKGQIIYSDLDDLGRTGIAKGTLTYANVERSYGIRQSFGSKEDPSGWGSNAKESIDWLNGRTYNGYFWNRSHLIGDALGGDALKVNAITGTRTQNVGGPNNQGGMRYTEMKAQEYLEANPDAVLYYSVEPVYEGTELVPRYVEVKMLSLDGSIDETVIVFNTANGFNIDYGNGTYSK